MQSHPPDLPPISAPDLLLSSSDHKKKQKERIKEENEQMDKNALYDIVSSPLKDSARLTLKLSRVRTSDLDESRGLSPGAVVDHATDLMNNNQLSRTAHDMPHKLGAEEQANCQQAPVQPNTKEAGVISGAVFDDAEMDTLADFERIEREAVSERERWSKEVQDKGEFPCACLCPVASCIFFA